MTIAVIGLEFQSQCREVLRCLRKAGVKCSALVAPASEAAEQFVKEHGSVRLDSVQQLIGQRCPPAGVIVASAVYLREEVIPLLEKGVATYFCKQLAPTHAKTVALLSAAKRGGAPVMGGSTRRYSPAFASLVEMGHRGELGRIVIAHRYEPHGLSPGDWQDRKATSGGYIVNFGLHCVESLCALLGSDFSSVHCLGGRFLHQGADSEDACAITIGFSGGSIGIAEVFGAQAPLSATQPSFRAHGTRRSVEAFVDEGLVRGVRGARVFDPAAYAFCSGIEQSADAFLQMLQKRRQPVSFEEMESISEILFLARQSYEIGRSLLRNEVL